MNQTKVLIYTLIHILKIKILLLMEIFSARDLMTNTLLDGNAIIIFMMWGLQLVM